jgi:hypothetical protein
LNKRKRLKKAFRSYFKNNGIIVLKKHVDANHGLIAKKIEDEMDSNMKVQWKEHLQRKGM